MSNLSAIANILNSLDLDGSPAVAPTPAVTPPKSPNQVAKKQQQAAVAAAVAAPAVSASVPAKGIPFSVAKQMFYDAPGKNVKKYLPFVMKAMQDVGLGDTPMLLMALGTIRAESAAFQPISEYKSKYNTSPSGHPYDLYDDRKALGNRGAPDGASFKGRGFIQLTGRANYTQLSEKLGLGTQLIDNPDLGNDPEIAARLLAAFIKNKETKIRNAVQKGDLKSARRYVNGGSHGLKQFSAAFNKGMELMAVL